jgi:phosphatidylserine/phosphatidylglycerophosphate/cardiolipin synthase-like enzyme
MSKKQLGGLAGGVLGLLILLLFVVANFLGLGGGASPTPVVEPTQPAGRWYQLHFTDPATTANADNPTGGIPAAIIRSFDQAQRSIDVAIYEIDYQPFAEALIAAHERGVAVRVVTDSDYRDEKPVKAIARAGIPVAEDKRDAFMHHKFAVLDGARVWSGSMNFTFSDSYRNNNSMLLIESATLAENYSAQFERLFEQQNFEQAGAAPSPAISLGGALVENYFSPNGGVAGHILDVLRSARRSVRFMAFAFTRNDFAEVLIEKVGRGVTVQGVFERRQLEAGADGAWNTLRRAGLDVRRDGNPYNLHSKVFIVDEQIVVVGSYNFSRNAEEFNNENVLIIHDPEIAAAYTAEWQKVWTLAEP